MASAEMDAQAEPRPPHSTAGRAPKRAESMNVAVVDLTSLDHTLLGKGTHALWNGGVETEETKLRRRSAVRGASLIGGGLRHSSGHRGRDPASRG